MAQIGGKWATSLVLGALSALLAAGCAAPGGGGSSAQDTSQPLKVGFIAGLTGTAAAPAADMKNGFELYWESSGGKVAGRKVETFIENDEGKPEVGLSVARRLVEQQKVDVVVGPHFANVGTAVAQYLATTDTPMIYPIPASSEFLKKPIPSMFLAGGTASQFTQPLGKWAAQKGYKKAATISSDYSFGHEIAGGFTNTFTDYGGTVGDQIWVPLGTTDYGPFVSKIAAGNYDVVFDGLQAQDAVVFQQAWGDFGLAKKGPALLASPSTVDQSLLRTMKESAVGTYSTGHFAEGRSEGETAKFVAAYEKKYGKIPGYYAASGYFGAQITAAALEKLNGKIPNSAAFITTAKKLNLADSVFGPIKMDAHGNINMNVYIRKVEPRAAGGFWNVVESTIPNVAPEFEYKYESFLAEQPYTRDNQGQDWPKSCADYTVQPCPVK
jgi:branched-chain amino acid transport system substrate-binding protein